MVYIPKNKATVFLTARVTDEGVVRAIPFSLPIIAYQLEKIKRLIKQNKRKNNGFLHTIDYRQ